MKKLFFVFSVLVLAGCAQTVQPIDINAKFNRSAELYHKSVGHYCNDKEARSFFEGESFIYLTCNTGERFTIRTK